MEDKIINPSECTMNNEVNIDSGINDAMRSNKGSKKYSVNGLTRDNPASTMPAEFKIETKAMLGTNKFKFIRKLIEEVDDLQKELRSSDSNRHNIMDSMVNICDILVKALQVIKRGYESSRKIVANIIQILSDKEMEDSYRCCDVDNIQIYAIVRKIYLLATDALRSNKDNNECIKAIESIRPHFTLLMYKLNIEYAAILSISHGKYKYHGGFSRNIVLLSVELPNGHHRNAYYSRKFSKDSK